MRKLLAVATSILLLAIATPAQAATPVVRIVDVPHTNLDGSFRDNDLVLELTPGGSLGKALFGNTLTTTWVIDPALLDEVIDMADGYTFNGKPDPLGKSVAQIWLNQLRIATIGNPVVALPYGNPDTALARKLNPLELKYYTTLGQQKLEDFFGKPVISQNGWGQGKSHLDSQLQGLYKSESRLLASFTKVIQVDEITTSRMRLSRLLSPLLTEKDRNYFSYQARDGVGAIGEKLKVVSGRYQLTSEKVKVPLTVINDFDTATVVTLSLIPLNSRVQVENVNNITIPPHSHIQIAVPFKVIASGSTVVLAQFMTPDGSRVGEVSRLNLSLTVIDSRVAWFTSGAAILLFLGAVAQSVRRIRRGRNEK